MFVLINHRAWVKKLFFIVIWLIIFIIFKKYVTHLKHFTMLKEDYPWKFYKDYKFLNKFVHLDLKGAPPSIYYFDELFKYFQNFNVTGILIEYEDMFPYIGDIKVLAREDSYKESDVSQILTLADKNNLDVIPLIQTFGHMEFILKHEEFKQLREDVKYSDVICPSKGESFKLIKLMIDQIKEIHPNIKKIHVGLDEVYHIGVCPICSARLAAGETRDDIFLSHALKIVKYIQDSYPNLLGILMWDDMFRHIGPEMIQKYRLGDFVELVAWDYQPQIFPYIPPHVFDKYFKNFKSIWAASAFKGATGESMQVTDISYHLTNNYEWLKVMGQCDPHYSSNTKTSAPSQVNGIILTGWQRYNHLKPLCELLPSGFPSLLASLMLHNKDKFTRDEHRDLSRLLIIPDTNDTGYLRPYLHPFTTNNSHHIVKIESNLQFPGSEIYLMVKHNYNLISRLSALSHNFYNNQMEGVGDLKMAFQTIHDELLKQKMFVMSENFTKYFYGITTSHEWIQTFIEPYLDRINHVIGLI